MKLIFSFLSIFLVILLLSSCELDKTSKSNPQISFPKGNITAKNTGRIIELKLDAKNKSYYIDTLYVDSILHFESRVYAGSGYLSEFSAFMSNKNAGRFLWKNDFVNPHVTNLSDSINGRFYIGGEEKFLTFTLEFIPTIEDKDFILSFEAKSNENEYNHSVLTIKTPIKAIDSE